MIYDSINLLEGSNITNLTAPTGTAYPSNANAGEIFFRTDSPNVGLYTYSGTAWVSAGSGGGSSAWSSITGTPTTLSGYGITDAVSKAGSTMNSAANIVFNGGTVTGLPSPTGSTDAVNKAYADALVSSVNIHGSVEVATTANLTATYANGTAGVGATLTNSGTQAALSIDSYSPIVGARVLVKNQTTQTQNGIYVVTTVGSGSTNWVLTRATDSDNHIAGQVAPGDYVFVSEGTVNASTSWTETGIGTGTNDAIIIGTNNIVFTQFAAAGSYLAGTGLSLSGSTFNVNLGAGIAELPSTEVGIDVHASGGLLTTIDGTTSSTNTAAQLGIKLNGTTLSLSSSGLALTSGVATTGTYKSVTVDTYGRVTAGTNPTTLSGFGITDAVQSNSAITAGTYKSVTVDTKGLVTAGTNPTTLAGYGITDAVSTATLSTATITTTSTTATAADTFATATSKVVEYLIQVSQGSSYQASKVLVVTDGTTINITEYGQIYTGSTLGDFTADISGANARLLFTAASASSTVVKVIRTSII
jgi:hypothetical protein